MAILLYGTPVLAKPSGVSEVLDRLLLTREDWNIFFLFVCSSNPSL